MSDHAHRTAVFVRAHIADEKTLHLLEMLDHYRTYDLFVLANETAGPLEFTMYNKVVVSASDFEENGFPCANQYTMKHLSDVIFGMLKSKCPGYDFYAVVEYDVDVQRAGFLNDIVERIESAGFADLDLVAVNFGPQPPSWPWYAGADHRFGRVMATFFPFVILSSKAIDALIEERRREGAERSRAGLLNEPDASGKETDWVFCEAFVGSALAARGDMRMTDLNELLPGAYRQQSFNIGPPELFRAGSVYDPEVALVHPVCMLEDMLAKRLYIARAFGQLPAFVNDLDLGRWPMPNEVRDRLRNEAR